MTASEPAGFCKNSRSQGRMPASQHADASGPLTLISCVFRPSDAALLPAEKEVDSSTRGFVNRTTQGTAANPEFPRGLPGLLPGQWLSPGPSCSQPETDEAVPPKSKHEEYTALQSGLISRRVLLSFVDTGTTSAYNCCASSWS